ncbi:hypothetical protein CALK_1241 [Chitinivibrio alkaliphilus ACht1]|uniref:Response regulatory domain-containing protein n=2 Tax=Chitinivibrio TaxID=1505231 RepID=U7DBJ0_9BACT|nr:hypothetical protein CALK_1241 [Chitinivibrio alkaliphilus ACht1]
MCENIFFCRGIHTMNEKSRIVQELASLAASGEFQSFYQSVITQLPHTPPEVVEEVEVGTVLSHFSEDEQQAMLRAVENVFSVLVQFYGSEHISVKVAVIRHIDTHPDAEALPLFQDLLGDDTECDILITKKIASRKSVDAFSTLLDITGSPNVYVRDFAKTQVKSTMKKEYHSLVSARIEEQKHRPNQVIPLLDIVSDLGIVDAEKTVRRIVQSGIKNPNVRALAYKSLIRLSRTMHHGLILDGLFDISDDVAFAVAQGVEEIDHTLVTGVANMILSSVYSPRRLAEVLVFTDQLEFVERLYEHACFQEALSDILSYQGMEQYREKYEARLNTTFPVCTKRITHRKLAWAIDDEPFIRKRYLRMGVGQGIPLRVFEEPEKALDALQDVRPDIIFVDMNMPTMNGVEFTRKVRNIVHDGEIPVVLVTTQDDVLEDTMVQDNLFHTIIQKPFDDEELRDILRQTGTSSMTVTGR